MTHLLRHLYWLLMVLELKATNLHVYKDSNNNSYLAETGSGDLYIKGGNDLIIQDAVGNTLIHGNQSDSVELHYGGSEKLKTKNTGIEITGILNVDTVNNKANSANIIYRSGTNTIVGNHANALVVTDAGTVGIGNTAPSSGNKLHVTGNARIEGNLTINGTTTIVDTDVSTTEQLLITNDGTGPAIVANQTGTQPVVDFQDDGTSAFYIKNGGNVGISETSPDEKLEVAGNILAKDSGVLAGVNGAKDGFIFHDLYTSGGNYYGYKGFTSPARLSTVTDGVERLTVDANGKVGIGTTSVNSGIGLQVQNGALYVYNGSAKIHDIRADYFASGNSLKLVSGGSGNIIFKVGETNEVARFDSSGNLGIGTTSPAMPVEIVTGSGATVDLPNQTTGGIAFANNSGSNNVPTIVGKSDSSMGLEIIGAANNSNIHGDLVFNCRENNNSTFADTDQAGFKFQHYTTDLVTIYRSGKVGIGNSTPQEQLHVADKVRIDNVPTASSEATALVYGSGNVVSRERVRV